ncbi:helix-turn-helix transcriptional regulator [Virgisporangium ochraceum]
MLREQRGVTRARAADLIRASESKISRMELGRVGFKERDLLDLLTLYGVHDEVERAVLVDRLREANSPVWWQAHADVVPGWFQRYLNLEPTAALIRAFEVQFVPGLLQTEDYARAVVRLGHPFASAEEVEKRVRLRLDRQQILHRPDAPRLWAVIDEAVLRRALDGGAVMRDQVAALIVAVPKLRHVRLQVLPLASGGHAAAGGSFTILRFPHHSMPDVVYIEQLTSSIYLERPDDVDRYFDAVSQLFMEAAPITGTLAILERIIDELRS